MQRGLAVPASPPIPLILPAAAGPSAATSVRVRRRPWSGLRIFQKFGVHLLPLIAVWLEQQRSMLAPRPADQVKRALYGGRDRWQTTSRGEAARVEGNDSRAFLVCFCHEALDVCRQILHLL